MYKKKVFAVLMVASLVFIVSSLIVSSACCLCPEKQVKIKEVSIPWQSWNVRGHAVVDIIQVPQDFVEPVFITRQWATLPQAPQLEELTWDETEAMVLKTRGEWMGVDKEPMQVRPGGKLTLDIPVAETDEAAVVLYTVAVAAPDNVVAHVANAAILAPGPSPGIVGWLSNPDIHNNTGVEVDNFELDLYGVEPSDVTRWYMKGHPIDYEWKTRSWGMTLYGGWGAPPEINKIPGGTEVKWKDASYPIKPCQWVHFGLGLKPGVVPTDVKAYWTRLCP